MAKITDMKIDPPKILAFGPPTSGKSMFMATGGETVQFIDIDHNLRGALNLKDKWTEERRKIDVLECRDNGPNPGAFMRAKEHLINIANQCHAGKYPFKVLVIDSLTTLSEGSLRQVMQGKGTRQPTQPEWGLAINDVEECCRILKGLPIAVVMIAHQTVEEIDGSNKVTINAIGQKLPRSLPAYYDEIWYFKLKQGIGAAPPQFVIQTQPSPAVISRSGGALPNDFDQNRGLQEAMKIIGYDISPKPVDVAAAKS